LVYAARTFTAPGVRITLSTANQSVLDAGDSHGGHLYRIRFRAMGSQGQGHKEVNVIAQASGISVPRRDRFGHPWARDARCAQLFFEPRRRMGPAQHGQYLPGRCQPTRSRPMPPRWWPGISTTTWTWTSMWPPAVGLRTVPNLMFENRVMGL